MLRTMGISYFFQEPLSKALFLFKYFLENIQNLWTDAAWASFQYMCNKANHIFQVNF